MKKTIITIILMLICLELATAGTLGVRLNNYNGDSHVAKLEVQNWGAGELYNIELSINGSKYIKVLNGIKGDTGVEITQTILPGTLTITLRSSDGQVVDRTMTLQKSAATLTNETNKATQQENADAFEEYNQGLEEQEKLLEQQRKEREELVERLRSDPAFAEEYFKSKQTTTTSATTTTIEGQVSGGGIWIVWLLVVIAVASLLVVAYSIYKRHKK